jgi:hypothetical protein
MPYKIVEVSRGKYKVKKNRQGRPIYMSKKALSLTMAKRQLKALCMNGGDMGEDKPTIDSLGLKTIPVGEFAAYQQYLINATPQELQLQDISTVPGGKYIDLGVKLASMIPEYGIIFDVLGQVASSVIGLVYKPKETIAQRLKSHGIDIYADDTYIVNDEYPDTDPRHFEIILPNGIWTNAQYQSAYAALLYYQKVLGFDVSKWINRISPAERQFLFRPGDAQWPAQYQGLAMLHGHANPYISSAKFEK